MMSIIIECMNCNEVIIEIEWGHDLELNNCPICYSTDLCGYVVENED